MRRTIALASTSLALGGCFGLDTPIMEEFYEPYNEQRFIENVIVNHVKCELRQGLEFALNDNLYLGHRVDWLKTTQLKLR